MIVPKTPKKKAASRRKKPKPLTTAIHPVLQPHAAGIDVGATAMYVAVPCDADPCPVRTFGTFTALAESFAIQSRDTQNEKNAFTVSKRLSFVEGAYPQHSPVR